ncbi:MAG: hypothetical protein OER97_09070 [Gammaproteobacteria bacterium]|nr:hypothetical protein [Gammaproteobacteria bacterium]
MKLNAHLTRTCLSCVCLCLPCISNGANSVDICRESVDESYLSIAYYDSEEASFESNLGETNRENYSADLRLTLNNNWVIGGGLRSTVLNVDRLALQTNGYLHSIFLPLHRVSRSENTSFRFSIAPTLSASSNITKNPSEYTSDALQLLATLVWRRQISDRVDLRYGICGDHRFGEYRVYPIFSVNWQPHTSWLIELGLPSSQLNYQVTKSLASIVRIAPNGNEWQVKDKSLEKHSQLIYEAYIVEWLFNWRVYEHFMLTASVGREFHGRYEMTLLNENRVRLESDPATQIGVAMAWFF